MKLQLLVLLGFAFFLRRTQACRGKCNEALRGYLLCAFNNGCYLTMEFCSLIALNCGHLLQNRPLYMVKSEGKCQNDQIPYCKSMVF